MIRLVDVEVAVVVVVVVIEIFLERIFNIYCVLRSHSRAQRPQEAIWGNWRWTRQFEEAIEQRDERSHSVLRTKSKTFLTIIVVQK